MEKENAIQERAQSQSLRFKVEFDGQPSEEIKLVAYAFDSQGALLASAPVNKEGRFQLELGPEKAQYARLMLSLALPKGREEAQITPQILERLRAYEPLWKFEPRKRAYELLPIPKFHWEWWLWCLCRVRGRVVRPVTINGVTYDKPVCHARVHVCEVDTLRIVIPRLPDDLIIRIREELLHPIPRPPFPDPPPFRFDPRVFDFSARNIAAMQSVPEFELGEDFDLANPQPPPSFFPDRIGGFERDPSQPPSAVPDFLNNFAFKAALQSSSIAVIKQALLDNLLVIRPYICFWQWVWPYFYTCDELAVIETDNQGRFDTLIFYLCVADHPDLYFWVEYCLGGAWTTVYQPPMACNTHWDYVCSSDVIIRVTDPRVPWCSDGETVAGKQVAVMLIGNKVSMAEIQGQAAGANEGLTTDDRPFGGSLEPHVWFGDALIASGITHYRWSYRRLGSSGAWLALDREVVRHYAEVMPDTTLHFKPFVLGPDPAFSGQSLSKIRPLIPPLNPGVDSSSWAPEVDARENTASAFFLSHLLEGGNALMAAGKYELKLELFKSDGSLVNWTTEGVLPKVPTIAGPFGVGMVPTVAPTEEHLIRNAASEIIAFRLVLHVDNNKCTARIYSVQVDGSATADECGFVSYASKVSSNALIRFRPFHPHNFARFIFMIRRGTTITPVEQADGPVGDSVVDGYTRNAASIFSKSVAVSNLLGSCDKAAFAETLYVNAIATDGWSDELDYLDSGLASAAFALEPAAS